MAGERAGRRERQDRDQAGPGRDQAVGPAPEKAGGALPLRNAVSEAIFALHTLTLASDGWRRIGIASQTIPRSVWIDEMKAL